MTVKKVSDVYVSKMQFTFLNSNQIVYHELEEQNVWWETTPPCAFYSLKTTVPLAYLFKEILDEWYDSQRLVLTSKTNAGFRICTTETLCSSRDSDNKNHTAQYHRYRNRSLVLYFNSGCCFTLLSA